GGVAFDGDAVVVVNPTEFRELKMACQRRRFTGDPFHHVAVATDGVDVVIDHRKAGTIEIARHPAAGQRDANAVGDALTERAGRRLDTGSPAVFGMPGTLAIELPESFDVVKRHR